MRCLSLAIAALPLLISGCGTAGLFGEYDVPEEPETAAAPYPRLVDVPQAPPVGTFTDSVPDPATGLAIRLLLQDAAASQAAQARALDAPVLSEADRRRLGL